MKRFWLLIFLPLLLAIAWPRLGEAAVTCSVLLRPATLVVRDGHGAVLAGVKVAWYREGIGPDGQKFFNGKPVGTGTTNAVGQWSGCLPKGGAPLALNLYTYNATLSRQVYWSESLGQTDTAITASVNFGTLAVTLRNGEGAALRNIKFDVYAERRDVNNTLIFDTSTLVAGRQTTGLTAQRVIPLGSGTFVLRITSDIPGRPIIREPIVVADGQAASADLRLETFRLTVVDGIGRVQPKFKFSLYNPGPNGQLTLVGKPLVSSQTDATGRKDLLLPTGTYNVVASGTLATVFRKWNLPIPAQELTSVTFRLSGLRILVRDPAGRPVFGARFSLFRQRLDDQGKPAIDRRIIRNRAVNKIGYSDLLLPEGSYVAQVNNTYYYNIDVAAEHFTRLDVPRTLTLRVSDEASLVNPLLNGTITYKPVPVPNGLMNVSRMKTVVSGSYRLKIKNVNRPLTAIFYISRSKITNENIDPKKLRIAFYSEKTKRWSYIGRYDRARNQFVAPLRQAGIATLVVIR